MNVLYGKIINPRENGEDTPIVRNNKEEWTPSSYADESVELEARRIVLNGTQKNAVKKSEQAVFAIVGEIHNLHEFRKGDNDEDDLDVVARLYEKLGIQGLNQLDGLFTIAVADKQRKCLFVVQDRHTSLNHLYYYDDGDALYLSTDVKVLLNRSKLTPEVNRQALPTYLHYAFVPGNETLFQHIYKLPTGKLLQYDYTSRQTSLIPNPPYRKHEPTDDKEQGLVRQLDEALKARMQENGSKQVAVMFSGGYDSNLMLSRMLALAPDAELKLFSYGSTSPKSEIHNIRRIVDLYQQMGYKLELHDYTVHADDLHRLPKMMFNLGEPLSEPGLIFQACLAETLHRNKVDIVIGGDANDQVYDRRLFDAMIEKLVEPKAIGDYPKYGRLRLGEIDRIFTYKFFTDIETEWLLCDADHYPSLKLSMENYATVFTNYFLTKRLIFKHYGIQSRLPYLSARYIDYIDAHLNEEDLIFKELHVRTTLKLLPEAISQELVKATESSSPYSYVFLEDQETRRDLFQAIRHSETAKAYFRSSSIEKLLDGFDFAIEHGHATGDYYKASVLSCRIFTIIGFLTWHQIFISTDAYLRDMSCDANLFELLGKPEAVAL